MNIEKIEGFDFKPGDLVGVKPMGNVIEVKLNTNPNHKATVRKIDEKHYIKVSTGEVFEYSEEKDHNRLDNIKAVRRSLSELREVLNTNITDVSKCRWVTLTYAENMTDTERLYNDFRKFVMRFRYYLEKRDYKSCEYIVAMEPQGRGAWHCHIVFIFDKKAPYIPNEELREIWSQGFVTVKKLEDVDNVGAYLTAYLGDMELEEAIDNNLIRSANPNIKINPANCSGENIKEVIVDGATKKYIKGFRLRMYPTGFHLWRASRGIKKPEMYFDSWSNAQKKVSSAQLTYQSTVKLSDDDFTTIISKRYYNTKR